MKIDFGMDSCVEIVEQALYTRRVLCVSPSLAHILLSIVTYLGTIKSYSNCLERVGGPSSSSTFLALAASKRDIGIDEHHHAC